LWDNRWSRASSPFDNPLQHSSGAIGAARECFEPPLEYIKERLAFGKAIEATQQIHRAKLADRALTVTRELLALHLQRMKDDGVLWPEDVGMSKLGNVNAALDVRERHGRCAARTA
jgi:glutaryl-CoA dehydrogenase